MSFQYVSSMRLPLRRGQTATADPTAEILSGYRSLPKVLGGAAALLERQYQETRVELDVAEVEHFHLESHDYLLGLTSHRQRKDAHGSSSETSITE